MTRGMMNRNNLDKDTQKKRDKITKKIIDEHFEMTLTSDRNTNYLWFMYKDGTKKGDFRPFILLFEINLLLSLNIITADEKHNMLSMFDSEDNDNVFMGLLALENLINKRIKIHGKWTKEQDVSDEFRDVVSQYPTKVVELYLGRI
jgi:hypothetical protein